jgi:hypoxanthine phosphoribosyltransferase
MVDTKSKICLNWDEIEDLVKILAEKIKTEQPQIDSIMGLPRGGLIPAVMLSHKLNLPLVSTPSKRTLIVDDICDSGDTFMKLIKEYPLNLFACLHYKSHTSRFIPEIWAIEHTDDRWIIYPWERHDSDTIQDYLK